MHAPRLLHLVLTALLLTPAAPAAAARTPALELAGLGRLAELRRSIEGGGLTDALRATSRLGGTELRAPGLAVSEGMGAVARLVAAVELAGVVVEQAVPLEALPADEAGVDQAALLAAAALITETVDQAIPDLRRLAARAPTGATGVTCDQLDQPNVCVGGSGANTYPDDKALLIDLGGDDLHANSAGGADRVNGLPVSVTIDMGGNDRYETALPTAGRSTVAQGSATGGIGILVDVAGNDSYTVTTSAPGVFARGQGFAGLGVGILADKDGADSYRVTHAPPGNATQRAQGQAFAGVGGTAMLLDDLGSDTYVLESRPVPAVNTQGQLASGAALVQGFGYAEAGVALAYDGAGASGGDRMTLQALSDGVAPDEQREVVAASATTEGFGFSTLGGTAVVLTGIGNSTWTARSIARAPQTGNASVSGFGTSSTAGYAALNDAGGNDTYLAEARTLATRTVVANDECACQGAVSETAAGTSLARIGGMGGAAVGVLADAGGNDRYTAVAESRAEAVARDDRTQLPPDDPLLGARATATAGTSTNTSLGFGAAGGAGFLIDHGGDDVYELSAASDAIATATAIPADSPREGVTYSGVAATSGEAAGSTGGYGELRDSLGSDKYTATARSLSQAEPATSVSSEIPRTSAQGSVEAQNVQGVTDQVGGGALLLEIDRGMADTYSATPTDPPCTGTRGDGVWKDCGPGVGGGFAA